MAVPSSCPRKKSTTAARFSALDPESRRRSRTGSFLVLVIAFGLGVWDQLVESALCASRQACSSDTESSADKRRCD
jgi:hypothetical protein